MVEFSTPPTPEYFVAIVLIPFVDHNAPIRLPAIVDLAFWRDTAANYVGYAIIIAAFFFIRTELFRAGGGRTYTARPRFRQQLR